MTEQTWNKEQIEEAFGTTVGLEAYKIKGLVIAELTHKWTPTNTNEVYCYSTSADDRFTKYNKGALPPNVERRPLTPDEVPALKVAIEALKQVTHGDKSDDIARKQGAREALAKIKELADQTENEE